MEEVLSMDQISGSVLFRGAEGIAGKEKVYRKLREHAEEAYPQECCGLLFCRTAEDGKLMIEEYIRAENVSDRKETHYKIDPLTMFRYETEYGKRGYVLKGFYHSHPDEPAVPSEEDVRKMLPELLYLILSVTDGKLCGIRAWRKERNEEIVRELHFEK